MANGDILFQAFPLADWPWGGVTGNLYIFDTEQWTDQNGMVHLTNLRQSLIEPLQKCPILVNGRVPVVQDFYYQPTVLSIERANARRTGVVFDSDDYLHYELFNGWAFPGLPNPMTWKDFTLANHAQCRQRLQDRYYDAPAIDAKLAGLSLITPTDKAKLATARGTANMVAGAVVVPSVLVTGVSLIKAWSMSAGVRSVPWVDPGESTVGVNFTIRSSDGGDNGLVGWEISEPF